LPKKHPAAWLPGAYFVSRVSSRSNIINHPYYPNFGRLSAAYLAVAQPYYDFTTAYGESLVTPTWTGGINEEVRLGGVRRSQKGEPGTSGRS
jgi:hypothetical protein